MVGKKELAIPMVAQEADVNPELILDFEETIVYNEDSASWFRITHNFVAVVLSTNLDEKRELALRALAGMWGTRTQLLTATTEDEVFAYLRFGEVEEGTFFVGTFPIGRSPVEEILTDRERNALRWYASPESRQPEIKAVN